MTLTTGPFTAAFVPAGATSPALAGAASIYTALSDGTDTSYVSHYNPWPTTESIRFVTRHTNPLTTNQSLDYIQLRLRQAYTSYAGWFYPATITGFVGSIPHTRNLSPRQAPTMSWDGYNVNPSRIIEYWWEATWGAADGTQWADCDYFEVTWALHAVASLGANGQPVYFYATTSGGIYHQASLAWITMEVSYTQLPIVGSITPSATTVTTPQPTATWWTAQAQQTSYQVAFVPTGMVDSNGVAVGLAGFDPDRADLASTGWNSGRVYSPPATQATSAVPLPNGTYYTYVRAWTYSPRIPFVRDPAFYIGVDEPNSYEQSGPWAAGSLFTMAADNVNPPAVALADDSTYYTVRVTISPGATTGGYQFPHAYEVRYLVDGEWLSANVVGGPNSVQGQVAGNATTEFYDPLQRPGATVTYRARSLYVRGDGQVAVTAWVMATITAPDKKEWWLRSLGGHTLNRTLSSLSTLMVRDWSPVRRRPQSVTWGVGARGATVTHDMVKSATMSLDVWAMTDAARSSLYAMLEGDDDLVLVSPWRETWLVQVGEEIGETQQRAAPRSGEATPIGMVRVVSFTLTEVG